jgi:hypothetical protein
MIMTAQCYPLDKGRNAISGVFSRKNIHAIGEFKQREVFSSFAEVLQVEGLQRANGSSWIGQRNGIFGQEGGEAGGRVAPHETVAF